MRLRSSQLLAATSGLALCLLATLPAGSARRPRYGGTIRVDIGAQVKSLDPSAPAANSEEAAGKLQIEALLYSSRNADGTFKGATGSGPFRVAALEPGRRVVLEANEEFRQGRAFVDSIEFSLARTPHDRLLDLELGKTDLADIPPDQMRHASERGIRISQSRPDELVAILFLSKAASGRNSRVPEALERCIDRAAIVNFILQKTGEPAGGLLPQWSSGTAFLFSTEPDVARAKELWSQMTSSPHLALGYDSGDIVEQAIAERIAVNAREAGIQIVVRANPATGGAVAGDLDARLIRWRMPSPSPAIAFKDFLAQFGSRLEPPDSASPISPSSTPEDIYKSERAILSNHALIPLVWLPQVYGLSARVRNWAAPEAGGPWPLTDVWLSGEAQ